jgi:hypothetical protein
MNRHDADSSIDHHTAARIRDTAGLQPSTDVELAWYQEGFADALGWVLRVVDLEDDDRERIEMVLDVQ